MKTILITCLTLLAFTSVWANSNHCLKLSEQKNSVERHIRILINSQRFCENSDCFDMHHEQIDVARVQLRDLQSIMGKYCGK